MNLESPVSRATSLGVASIAGVALLAHAFHFDHVADDAYISLRYVDHWLRGDGLVFNPGERVMGFSNPGFVALVAALGSLGVPLVHAARALGIAASLACILLLALSLGRRASTPWPAVAAAAWLAASGPFALWSQAGLEGPLFALALLGAALGCERALEEDGSDARQRAGARTAAISLACAALLRPEGAGYALALAAWVGVRGLASGSARRDRSQLRIALALAGAGALAWLALALAAFAYYGDPLPNTYYAKAHPLSLELLERAAIFARYYLKVHFFAPAIAIGLFAVAFARRPADPRLASLVLIAAFVTYYARIGGDALVYYRMWAFVQPLFALLLAHAVAALEASGGPRRALARAAVALPLLCLANSFRGLDIDYLRTDDARIRDLGALGRALADLPPHTLLAANAIGAIGFESRLPLVDMLGLADAHIARAPGKAIGTPGHESHDGAYVLDREPDLVLVGIPRASATPLSLEQAFAPSFPSDRDLLEDPRFERDYAFRHLELPDGRYVAAFLRRDGVLGAGGAPPRLP